MTSLKRILVGLVMTAAISSMALAQGNPCNPCGGKNMAGMEAHGGTVFVVQDPMNRNSVSFKSTAPLEDIVGTSNQIKGQLVFDPSNPSAGGHGELMVPVKSLNTGIPLRNEHLASSDWLNADKHPALQFAIVEVKNVTEVKSTKDSKTFDVTVVGDFSLNGTTKRINVPARITYMRESEITKQRLPGDLLAARTTFDVSLADYGITGPDGVNLIGSRVGERVEVNLSLVASSAGASMADNPCGDKAANPCGGKKPQNPCNPCGGKM